MKTSIRTRLGYGLGLASIAAAAMLGIASTSATADVTPTSISATLDAADPTSGSIYSGPNGFVEGESCGIDAQSRRTGTFSYEVVPFQVSTSGDYALVDSDFRSDSAPFIDAVIYIVGPGADATPTNTSCVARFDQNLEIFSPAATANLTAGVTYRAVLTSWDSGATGTVGFDISNGAGSFLPVEEEPEPEGVSFEQAQAACVPGAAVPEGYTLKTGTAGNETLRGTSGNDLIRGLGGNDTIEGLGGDDILCGGAGNDTLRGGAGADFLFAEAGNDFSYGDAGDDVISGGLGNDLLNGGADTDTGLDTQGNNTFTSIESRSLEPAPQPTVTANR